MDISLPGESGLSVASRLLHEIPSTRILMLSVYHQAEYVLEAVRIGAHGYLLKDTQPADLREAVRTVANGGTHFARALTSSGVSESPPLSPDTTASLGQLTQRERQVLTGIAEDIGNVRFHALLSETFTRLSRVVTDFGGEVHRYVGDAMIATWPVGTPQETARPIRCLFACRDSLDAARSDLLHRHGHCPGFRASLHAGALVAGEIGGFKREIALVGDAMNTAARLEQACRTTGHALLASKPLLDRTELPPGIVATGIGSHLLRGKAERLELFALERGAQDAVDPHVGAGALAEGDAHARQCRLDAASSVLESEKLRSRTA